MIRPIPARWRRVLFAGAVALAGCLLPGPTLRPAHAQTANFLPPPRMNTVLTPRYAPGAPGQLRLGRYNDLYLQNDQFSPARRLLRGAVPVLEAQALERSRLGVLYDLDSTPRGEPAFGRAQLQADRAAADADAAGAEQNPRAGGRPGAPRGLPQDYVRQTGHPVVFQSDLKGNQQDFRSIARQRSGTSLADPDPLGAFSPEDDAAAGGTPGKSKSAHTGHLSYFGNDGRHFTSWPQPPHQGRAVR